MKFRSAVMMALAEIIRERGMTKIEAADLFGVTQRCVSDLMRGKINLFSLDTLFDMVAAAGSIASNVQHLVEASTQLAYSREPTIRNFEVADGVLRVRVGREGDEPNNFQISVPIQPGNSGGPLINREGAVVGIVVAKLSAAVALKSGSQIPETVNYAVKSNYLLELINTDLNVSEQVQIAPRKGKESLLPTLVAKVEAAVVFITATKSERERPATAVVNPPKPVLPPDAPRYERERERERETTAKDDLLNGQKADRESRLADAVFWYRKSADQGNANAIAILKALGML